jgi:hypothetical protein
MQRPFPSWPYNIPINEISEAVDQGYFFMKIKIGQPGYTGGDVRKRQSTTLSHSQGHWEG